MLVVYIPTYNRLTRCERQLEALFNQKTNRPFRVVVSDNGSFPPFDRSTIKNTRVPVELIQQESNKGIGFNLSHFVSIWLDQREWVWTLSDDDIIQNDAIEQIYSVIDLCNERVGSVKFSHRQQNPAYKTHKLLNLNDFIEYFNRYKSTDFIFYSTNLYSAAMLNSVKIKYLEITGTYVDFAFLHILSLKFNYEMLVINTSPVEHYPHGVLTYNHVDVFNANAQILNSLRVIKSGQIGVLFHSLCAVNLYSVSMYCLRSSFDRYNDVKRIDKRLIREFSLASRVFHKTVELFIKIFYK